MNPPYISSSEILRHQRHFESMVSAKTSLNDVFSPTWFICRWWSFVFCEHDLAADKR